ncbi:MFS transporter [Sphingobium scionense]
MSASAGQTAILAFLPTLVDPNPGGLSSAHDFHVASLTAVHPLAALVAAPLWGWIADRVDYRVMLRTALIILAMVTAPVGLVALPTLYVLRTVAGMAPPPSYRLRCSVRVSPRSAVGSRRGVSPG